MRRIVTAALAAAVPVVLLAGCGGGPSEADCKKALKAQYATALATGKQGHEPAACKGLPGKVIARLAGEVIAGQ